MLRSISYLNPSSLVPPASRIFPYQWQVGHDFVVTCGLQIVGIRAPSHSFCDFVMCVTMSDVEEQWRFQGFNQEPPLLQTPLPSSQIPARSALDFCEIHVPQSVPANRRIRPSGSSLPAASSGQLKLVCMRDQICTSGDPTASCSPTAAAQTEQGAKFIAASRAQHRPFSSPTSLENDLAALSVAASRRDPIIVNDLFSLTRSHPHPGTSPRRRKKPRALLRFQVARRDGPEAATAASVLTERSLAL